MTEKRKQMRWRKRDKTFRSEEESHVLRRGGKRLAIVQALNGGHHWYSYNGADIAGSWNTALSPTSLEEAKADAMKRIRDAERGEG